MMSQMSPDEDPVPDPPPESATGHRQRQAEAGRKVHQKGQQSENACMHAMECENGQWNVSQNRMHKMEMVYI